MIYITRSSASGDGDDPELQHGDEHRAAIYETYVRGRTVREAAVVLGMLEGTVKSRVYTAMKILRRALREWR